MTILVTGAAGFIGIHTCLKLLKNNIKVVGVDNLNSYYDKNLKLSRLKILKKYKNFKFYKADIANLALVKKIFKKISPSHIIHLAAQAGVRYSVEKPDVYAKSNLYGFTNILEMCRNYKIKHLIFASSSSVYGGNQKYPFSESDNTDHPLSFYAATKKSNEIMAHSYSFMFNIPITVLRLFTVYGPWGRPDMSLFKFTDKIIKNKKIEVFNKGNMYRDFTYVDDVVNAIIKISKKIPKKLKKRKYKTFKTDESFAPFTIYNVGNNQPISLKKYISILEEVLKKKANKSLLLMPKADVKFTHANINKLKSKINYKPKTKIKKGVSAFIAWYKSYYNLKRENK